MELPVENAFEILGLPRQFDLTRAQIAAAYRRTMLSIHPDVSSASESAAETAARLNVAKETLENPLSRAEHLLQLIDENPPGRDAALPPDFLMEMMDVRETAETEIAQDGELARERWRAWAHDRRAEYVNEAQRAFAERMSPSNIRDMIARWRYIERMIEQLAPHYDIGRS